MLMSYYHHQPVSGQRRSQSTYLITLVLSYFQGAYNIDYHYFISNYKTKPKIKKVIVLKKK